VYDEVPDVTIETTWVGSSDPRKQKHQYPGAGGREPCADRDI
jgi:hypothetical protein